jgi:hypothetical protein
MDSRNFGRFVLALIISFLVIIGLGVLVVILFIPAIVGLTIFWAIFGILAAIFALVFAGSFLWYIAREEHTPSAIAATPFNERGISSLVSIQKPSVVSEMGIIIKLNPLVLNSNIL